VDLEDLVMSNPGTAWKLLRHVVDMLAEEQARRLSRLGAA